MDRTYILLKLNGIYTLLTLWKLWLVDLRRVTWKSFF